LMLRDKDELVVAATAGHELPLVGRRIPRGQGLAWRVLDTGRMLNIVGVIDRARTNYDDAAHSLVVPIVDGDAVLGTINLTGSDILIDGSTIPWLRLIGTLLVRVDRLARAMEDEVHPWRSQADVLLSWLPPGGQKRDARAGQLAVAAARRLGLDYMISTLPVAASLQRAAQILLPADYAVDSAVSRWVSGRVSVRLLEAVDVDTAVIEVVRCVGERWDGEGPLGKSGSDIPIMSRLLAAANALAALEEQMPAPAAMKELGAQVGTSICPHVYKVIGYLTET
jgi:hypothetical protein